jgi:hypothetical protein
VTAKFFARVWTHDARTVMVSANETLSAALGENMPGKRLTDRNLKALKLAKAGSMALWTRT